MGRQCDPNNLGSKQVDMFAVSSAWLGLLLCYHGARGNSSPYSTSCCSSPNDLPCSVPPLESVHSLAGTSSQRMLCVTWELWLRSGILSCPSPTSCSHSDIAISLPLNIPSPDLCVSQAPGLFCHGGWIQSLWAGTSSCASMACTEGSMFATVPGWCKV